MYFFPWPVQAIVPMVLRKRAFAMLKKVAPIAASARNCGQTISRPADRPIEDALPQYHEVRGGRCKQKQKHRQRPWCVITFHSLLS